MAKPDETGQNQAKLAKILHKR